VTLRIALSGSIITLSHARQTAEGGGMGPGKSSFLLSSFQYRDFAKR
jgi:hypothetical protein